MNNSCNFRQLGEQNKKATNRWLFYGINFGREVYPDAIAVRSMSNRYAIGESTSGSKAIGCPASLITN